MKNVLKRSVEEESKFEEYEGEKIIKYKIVNMKEVIE